MISLINSIDNTCEKYLDSSINYFNNDNLNTSSYTSEEVEMIIKNYLNNNLEELDKIEGIWYISSTILDNQGYLLKENNNWAKCAIIKDTDKQSPYDFIEIVIFGEGFEIGTQSATFNQTANHNIYFSSQMDANGTISDTKFEFTKDKLTSSKKIEENNTTYYFKSEYNKIYP